MIYSDEEQDNDDFEKFIALNKQTQNGNTREIIQQREQHQIEQPYSDQDDEDFEKFITVNLEQSKYVPQNNKRSLVNRYETPKQDKTQNRSSKFEFEYFMIVQQSPIRKPNNEQLWELMTQHLRIQLNHLPKQYVQIRDIMVGLFDDSKVEKLLGELHDIELYGDCAKATIKDSNGECKISIPAYIFQEDEFKQKNSNPNPKVTNVLVEIPRMDGIIIYAENVTVARLGDDRFLILGRNNLKLVSY